MRLRLRVKPGAPRSRVVGPYGERLKVDVSAPPEDGKANEELLRFLKAKLGAPVALVRGASSRDKEVEVEGLDAAEAMRRLAP